MPTDLLPAAAPAGSAALDPTTAVEGFLEALASSDVRRAGDLLADDVEYTNVGLPSIRGRERVVRFLSGLERPGMSFEVYLHAISADGPAVLTERTDVLAMGRFRAQFWVAGRFDVHDGLITLWRDSFDYLDVTRAVGRGLLAIAFPGLRPTPPSPGDAPGR
jgi:limonene-1,2-epoxide hydrolase